jgi:hypothetical protein
MFWTNLSPDGGDKPVDELAAAIDEQFGSFDAFRAERCQLGRRRRALRRRPQRRRPHHRLAETRL